MLVVCPQCSHTWEEFKTSGLLGCSRCYSVFKKELEEFFADYHGALSHDAKFSPPPAEDSRGESMEELIQLREKLAATIIREKFEEATAIKKRILELEKELGLD